MTTAATALAPPYARLRRDHAARSSAASPPPARSRRLLGRDRARARCARPRRRSASRRSRPRGRSPRRGDELHARAIRRGHAQDGDEEPVETGDLRQAIGELVTCSRCVGTWVAAGLAATQIVAPRFGRLLTWSLAAAGANDFLQAGFAALTHKRTSWSNRRRSYPSRVRRLALAALAAFRSPPGSRTRQSHKPARPQLLDLRIDNGSTPFAGRLEPARRPSARTTTGSATSRASTSG